MSKSFFFIGPFSSSSFKRNHRCVSRVHLSSLKKNQKAKFRSRDDDDSYARRRRRRRASFKKKARCSLRLVYPPPPPPPPPRERARAEEVQGEKRESATDGRAPRLSFLALLWCPREAFCLTRGRAKRRQFIRRRGGYETVLNGKRFRRENERKRELGGNLEKKRARWIREQRTHFCAG